MASLEAACARYHAEDHATTTSLMEGYRQLLTCLESQREPAPSSRSLVAEPQTYFEADLRALKEQAGKASERMLATMGHVDSAKHAAFDDWAFDVHDPNAVADADASAVRGDGADAAGAIDTSVHSVTHLAGILSGMSTPGGGNGRAASPPPPPSSDLRRGIRHAARSPPSRASTPRKAQQQPTPQPQPHQRRRHEAAAAAAASPSTPRRQRQHPASPVDPQVTPLTRDTAASSLSALYSDAATPPKAAERRGGGGGGGGSRVDASASLLHDDAATPPTRRGRGGAGGRRAASPVFAHDSTIDTSVQSSASSVHRLMSAMGTPLKAQRGGAGGGGGGGGGSNAHSRTRTRSPASTVRKPSPGRPAKRAASPAVRKPAAAAAAAPAPAPAAPAGSSQPRVPSFLLRADGTKMTPDEYRQRNEKLLANLRR